jgi:hypothetical protein
VDTVTILDRYERDPPAWYRKIGDGPWEKIDLSLWGGRLPVVWLRPVEFVITKTIEQTQKGE